jgi:hypothetical protein
MRLDARGESLEVRLEEELERPVDRRLAMDALRPEHCAWRNQPVGEKPGAKPVAASHVEQAHLRREGH